MKRNRIIYVIAAAVFFVVLFGNITEVTEPVHELVTDITISDSIADTVEEETLKNDIDEEITESVLTEKSEKNTDNLQEEGTTSIQPPLVEETENEVPHENSDAVLPEENFCTLSVTCAAAVQNLNLLPAEKRDLIPENGVIFTASSIEFDEGESAFDVLKREMKKNKIHLEFKNTPVYNSAYIEGINNLYEFDVGNLSGWMYKVNGSFPGYGCSEYKLNNGDEIEFVYTCNLGKDIGGGLGEGNE